MLNSVDLEKLAGFFRQFKLLTFKKKGLLQSGDDSSDDIFFINSGYLRAYRITEEGEELTMIILKPHDIFPVTFGLGSRVNNYYLEAITELEIYKSPKADFINYLNNNPDVYLDLSLSSMTKLDNILTRMEYLITGRAQSKIITTLLICASHFGEDKEGSIFIKVPLTHKDIANMVGITRETTSLEMKKLEKKGLVSHQGKHLIINDVKKLEAVSPLDTNEESVLKNSL